MEQELNSMDGRKEIVQSRYFKYIYVGFLCLLVNSGYLLAFEGAGVFYYLNILLHCALGLALLLPLLTKVLYFLRTDALIGKSFGTAVGKIGYFSMLIAFTTGFYLMFKGKSETSGELLVLHVAIGFLGFMGLISSIRRAAYNISVENTYWRAGRVGLIMFILAGILPMATTFYQTVLDSAKHKIRNPKFPPASLADAISGREDGVFYPSPAETRSGSVIDASFLGDTLSCSRSGCHADIQEEWRQSAHSQPAVDDSWYLANYAFVQDRSGDRAGNYCASCHAPEALFSGASAMPMAEMVQTTFAGSGIACLGCHAIDGVKSSLGDGAYIMDKPAMHWLTTARHPLLRRIHDLVLYWDPEPHRQLFSKAFHRKQPSAFCSSCHKMTLDAPLPTKFPVPGMHEYDTWFGSIFTERDVRGYYYSGIERSCTDCHMAKQLTPDPGKKTGTVYRKHTFQADEAAKSTSDGTANTPVFDLQIFAAIKNVEYSGSERKSVVMAPLHQENAYLQQGDRIRLDVLLKVLNYGHAFPAGSPGMVQAWIDLEVTDRSGKRIFSYSPLDSTGILAADAHKYGLYFHDAEGRRIYGAHGVGAERVEYANVIAPNSVDMTSFYLQVPPDCGPELELVARLNYRKLTRSALMLNGLSNGNTSHSVNQPMLDENLHASTGFQTIPVRMLAEDRVRVKIIGQALPFSPVPHERPDTYLAWTDYGLALLQLSRMDEALDALNAALAKEPGYHDGYVNLARAYLLEGQAGLALEALETAQKIDRDNPKSLFFKALALKMQAEYRSARRILKNLSERFYRDRGVINELGHVYLLEGSYEFAGNVLREVVRFAPDDPVAHFYLWHVYLRLEMPEKAAFEEKLYNRFSRKFNNAEIVPPLQPDDPVRDWQVLPWSSYFSAAGRVDARRD